MDEKEKLLHESKEEREARFAKAKEEFKSTKSARPMGYIYPQRIKAAMRGETPNITMYMNEGNKSEDHEIGETWETADGKIHTKNEGWTYTRNKNSDDFAALRVPIGCPVCHSPMNAKIDEKFFWLRGKCHKCVAVDETKMKIEGSFADYENLCILRNKLAFFNDAKVGLKEYYDALKPYQEYINHDGTLERWDDTHYEETKKFVEGEMIQVDAEIERLINEFKELEKADESSTTN